MRKLYLITFTILLLMCTIQGMGQIAISGMNTTYTAAGSGTNYTATGAPGSTLVSNT